MTMAATAPQVRRLLLPTPKLLLLLSLPVAMVLALPSNTTITIMIAFDLGLLVLCLMDLAVTPQPSSIHLSRQVGVQLSLGTSNRVGWEIQSKSDRDLRLTIHDAYPDGMVASGLPLTVPLLARSSAEIGYKVEPTARGSFTFGDTMFRYASRLGLFTWQVRQPLSATVKVYPNVKALSQYELSGQRRRLAELGMAVNRMRGRGGNFESLRNYVKGDDPADIAWKASARRGQLTTRNFESERSQNILVAIDCGRLMSTQVDDLTRLDHAINATLLLTHVAIKQHDYIGMVAFSDQIDAYMPMRKGRAALSMMNESLYRLEPRFREPNYQRVCSFLGLQQRKRSLIIIITDVIDTEASSVLLAYAARFARYHLPLVVTIRNPEIHGIPERRPVQASDVYEQAMATQLLERRATALATMQRSGVRVLDVNPRELTPRLIDTYLNLKRRNLL